jgi:hypothetical protein
LRTSVGASCGTFWIIAPERLASDSSDVPFRFDAVTFAFIWVLSGKLYGEARRID